jgi:riboflavin synthase
MRYREGEMFTGLIEANGELMRRERRGPGVTLTLKAPRHLVAELTLGESVAVDGACLTVTEFGGELFTVDASAETMERTTLGERHTGDHVHLERALKLGDRLGGHWVSGHVDATGSLRSLRPLGEAKELWFDAPPSVMRYVVEKGSITIDGASLTVNQLDERGFSVVLIPHTQGVLHISERAVGARVNLEADVLGKYVERLLMGGVMSPHQGSHQGAYQPSSLTLDALAKAGFLR